MRTFAQDIEEAAGEPIEYIVIGAFGWGSIDDGDNEVYKQNGRNVPKHLRGIVLEWEAARPYLDYEYDTGYGAPECHAITAWTANKVLYVVQYDGSTGIVAIPRNPIDHIPLMPGG